MRGLSVGVQRSLIFVNLVKDETVIVVLGDDDIELVAIFFKDGLSGIGQHGVLYFVEIPLGYFDMDEIN